MQVARTKSYRWILSLLLLSFGAEVWAAANDYQLGPGDLLKISVFGYPDLATDVRISDSGNITYPLLGELNVQGMSARQVEMLLNQRLSGEGYIRSAQVSVLIAEYQSQKVAVLGQVAKPGQYPLARSNTVLDLLADAGGVVNTAAADDATLLRRDGSKVSIDLIALFSGDSNNNPTVFSGDTIYVDKAPQFYIYGEVQRPGVYRLERGTTVSRAISASGGLTQRGSERRAMVKRRDESGKERNVSIRASDLLQPGDVLVVKESLF